VHRYGLQEVNEAAVEFLLGARAALAARFREQEQVSVVSYLNGEAESLSERIVGFFEDQRRTIDWSTRVHTVDLPRRAR
jgi:malonyl CoA-acyl carrier protein transacylase